MWNVERTFDIFPGMEEEALPAPELVENQRLVAGDVARRGARPRRSTAGSRLARSDTHRTPSSAASLSLWYADMRSGGFNVGREPRVEVLTGEPLIEHLGQVVDVFLLERRGTVEELEMSCWETSPPYVRYVAQRPLVSCPVACEPC